MSASGSRGSLRVLKGAPTDFVLSLPKILISSLHGFCRTVLGARAPPPTGELDDPEIFEPVLAAISTVLVFKQLAAGLVAAARLKLLVELSQGDASHAALLIGNMRSTGALAELLVGPLLGRISDRYGRLSVMIASVLTTVLGNALVLARPRSVAVHWAALLPVIALDTAFFAQMRAMMADVMTGRNIAQNAFMRFAPAGIVLVLTPRLASRLTPLQCYRIAAVVSLVAVWILSRQRETLLPDQRTEIDMTAANPFAFVKLFTNGGALARLALISGVQTYTDSRLLEGVATLSMRDTLRWPESRVSQMLSIMAASGFVGVPFGKASLMRFGRLGHTHFSHAAKALAYICWASARSGRTWRLAQLILAFGQRQRDGIETMITDIGQHKHGFGRGQIESWKFSWRSVSNALAPLAYSRAFALGRKKAQPSAPFVVALGFTLLSEVLLLQHEAFAGSTID